MKRLQPQGVCSVRIQAETFLEDDEDSLWVNGLLGDNKPQSLLDINIFCTSKPIRLTNF